MKKQRRWKISQRVEIDCHGRGLTDYNIPYSYEYWRNFMFLPKDRTSLGVLVEVGCGPSGVVYFVDESIGIDPLIGDYEKDNPYTAKTNLIKAVGEFIPLRDASVDSIIMCNALDHCFNHDQVIKELYRILRPGGILYFWSFAYELPEPLMKLLDRVEIKHPFHFNSKRIWQVLGKTKFKLKSEWDLPLIWMIAWAHERKRYWTMLKGVIQVGFMRARGICLHLKK